MLLLCMLAIVACGRETTKQETFVNNGILYSKSNQKPFTGYLVGKGREGYRRQVCTYKKKYKNGILDGTSKYWYKNGQLESTIPYKKGKIEGIALRYWPNGEKRARIHYKGGMRGGDQGEIFWDRKGKKIKEKETSYDDLPIEHW